MQFLRIQTEAQGFGHLLCCLVPRPGVGHGEGARNRVGREKQVAVTVMQLVVQSQGELVVVLDQRGHVLLWYGRWLFGAAAPGDDNNHEQAAEESALHGSFLQSSETWEKERLTLLTHLPEIYSRKSGRPKLGGAWWQRGERGRETSPE